MKQAQKQLQFVVKSIKEFRQQKSMSQLELSLKAELSQSFLASVENGKKQPSVLTILRIANALQVCPRSFFPERKNKTKEEIKDDIISQIRSL